MTWQPLERSVPIMDGKPVIWPPDQTQWQNDTYVVIRAVMQSQEKFEKPGYHLSIRRQDRQPCRDWRDFQRIKNQLAGPEYEAMELYPAESRLVDTANQYHLWCLPDALPIGFKSGRLVLDGAGLMDGAQQRPFEDVDLEHGGLTSKADYEALLNKARSEGVRGTDQVKAARLSTWED